MPNPVLDATRAKRDKSQTKLDELLKAPTAETRALTDDEAAKFEKLSLAIAEDDKRIKGLEKEEKRQERAAVASIAPVEKPSNVGGAVIRRETQTYDKWSGNGYYRDMAIIAAANVDPSTYRARAVEALGRLQQHGKEVEIEARADRKLAERLAEIRATPASLQEFRVNPNTTAGTGGEFVPPLWLVSQYVPFTRPGRVFANRCNNQPLPPGIDIINIPKITTGSLTAIQTANAAAVTSQDIVTSTVSAAVNTIAGQEDISMQLAAA